VLEVAEDPAGLEQREHLGVELALALVLEVVDGERRDHEVERAEVGERLGEVMAQDLDRSVLREALASGVQHRRREVEPDA
jgi:hypothetical protein